MAIARHLIAAAVLLGVATALTPLTASAQNIGTVASSEPTLRGTPPGSATRVLNLGTGVVQDETVASSATGRGQLLFVDQTTLSLAPNTTIVLDEFVFNPNGGGQMGVSMTQGALRFIGGALSRETEATVTTPTATIGIRGSSALVLFQNGRTTAIFLAGERLCIYTEARGRVCTSRQGGVLTDIDGYLGRVNGEYLATLLQLIDGAPRTGGAGGQGQAGTGIDGPNPSDRGPVSTTGEELDPDIFDDTFDLEADREFLPRDGGGGTNDGITSPIICNPLDPAPGCI